MYMPRSKNPNLIFPLWQFFPFLPVSIGEKHNRWRKVAKIIKISKEARNRLEWIISYHEGKNVSQVARYYGITRKTFYKWFAEFDESNLYSLYRLEDKSRAPKHVREREITPLEEYRIILLRTRYIRWGKEKIAVLYERTYRQSISSWKVQKVIEAYQLYYHPKKALKQRQKRAKARQRNKKRITELNLRNMPDFKKKAGYIICLDTITFHWNGLKRYLFTAVDKYGKAGYARMYTSKSSKNGEDFLLRLLFLLDNQLPKVGHDNGTEFEKHFRIACEKLKIEQYYSRVRTPTDNPNNERFNRTIEEEFIDLGNWSSDPDVFNARLTEWLIEYNFVRPHEALNYQTPMEVSKVLPMYSSCTYH